MPRNLNLFDLIIETLERGKTECDLTPEQKACSIVCIDLHRAIKPLVDKLQWGDMLNVVENLLSTIFTLVDDTAREEVAGLLTSNALRKASTLMTGLRIISEREEENKTDSAVL